MAKTNQETVIPDDSIPIKIPGYMRFSKVIGWLFYAWIIFGTIMLSFRVFWRQLTQTHRRVFMNLFTVPLAILWNPLGAFLRQNHLETVDT